MLVSLNNPHVILELFGLMVTSPLRPLFESRDHVFLIFVPLPSNSGPAESWGSPNVC